MIRHTTTPTPLANSAGVANPWMIGVLATVAAAVVITASGVVFAVLDPGAKKAPQAPAHTATETANPRPTLDCNRYLADSRKEGGAIAKDGVMGSLVGAAVGAAGGAIVDGKDGAGKGAAIGAVAGGVTGSVRKNEMENDRVAVAQQRYADCMAQS